MAEADAKLTKRIEKLEDLTTAYNIVGGIFIGLVVILIGVVVYMFFYIRKTKLSLEKKVEELDPLSKFTIRRPQMNHNDTNLVHNRFRTSEMNFPTLFDTSQPQHQPQSEADRRQDYNNHRDTNTNTPSDVHLNPSLNPIARPPNHIMNRRTRSPRSDSFLHRGSDIRDGPVFGQW